MYRLIGRLQEEYQFHFVITGHEGINKDKDDEAALSTLLSLLKHKNKLKAITSQSDVLARATIEEFDDNGEKKARYILNASLLIHSKPRLDILLQSQLTIRNL